MVLRSAEKEGFARTSRRQIDLYFRNQNRDLDEPLRLAADSSPSAEEQP